MTGTVLLLNILLSAISDCAYTLAVGLTLAAYFTSQSDKLVKLRKWLLSTAAIMLIAQSLRPWFLAASMSGSSRFDENLTLIPSILSSTHQGELWKLNIIAIVALFVAIGWMRRRTHNTIYLAASICLCIIAFIKAASGHAADNGDFTRLETLQWLHILATAVWAGTIIVTGLISLPTLTRSDPDNHAIWQHLQRISTTATYAIIVVLASGIYTADRELAAPLSTLWSSLWTSTWGKILIAKVIVVLFALALGAMNRFICLTKDMSSQRITLSSRLLSIEAGAMLVVLSLSGWLGNTSPTM
jgi:putative copper resistance protein D